MALEDTVEIVKKQISKLDKDHDNMILWAERFSKILFSQKLFHCYHAFHLLKANFTNSLIPITPYLPSEALSSSAVFPSKPLDRTENLLEKVKVFNSTIGMVILGVIITVMVYVSYQGFIPWVVPVALAGFLFFMALGVPERVGKALQKNEDSNHNSENPTEWMAKDLQEIGDKYDGIRLLIIAQNVEASQLDYQYRKLSAVLFSREQQEKEIFPTECLNIIGRIVVFCNNAYYMRKGELMSHLPGGRPVNLTQPSSQVSA